MDLFYFHRVGCSAKCCPLYIWRKENTMADSKEILIEQLASNLEMLRAGVKLTQEATAKAIGISRQIYCQIYMK